MSDTRTIALHTTYPNWISRQTDQNYRARIMEVIGDDKDVSISDVTEILGVSHESVMKTLFAEGFLRVDDGTRYAEGRWVVATKEERALITILPRTGIRRNNPGGYSQRRRLLTTTTHTEEQIEEADSSTEDGSWPLDLVGREKLTIEDLQDAMAIGGLIVEIRVRRA